MPCAFFTGIWLWKLTVDSNKCGCKWLNIRYVSVLLATIQLSDFYSTIAAFLQHWELLIKSYIYFEDRASLQFIVIIWIVSDAHSEHMVKFLQSGSHKDWRLQNSCWSWFCQLLDHAVWKQHVKVCVFDSTYVLLWCQYRLGFSSCEFSAKLWVHNSSSVFIIQLVLCRCQCRACSAVSMHKRSIICVLFGFQFCIGLT